MKLVDGIGSPARVSLLLQATAGMPRPMLDLHARARACAARLVPGAAVQVWDVEPTDASACADAAREHEGLWIGLGASALALSAPAAVADLDSLQRVAAEILDPSAAPAARPYADFAAWFEGFGADEDRGRAGARWWQERLHAPVRLPFALSSPPARRQLTRQALAPGLVADVAALAAERRVATASLWLACWWLLVRAVADETLSIWVLFDGRAYEGLVGVVGPLARRAPLAWSFEPDGPFEALLQQVDADQRQGRLLQEQFDRGLSAATGVGYAYHDAGALAVPAPGWQVADCAWQDDGLSLSLDVHETAGGVELVLGAPPAGVEQAALAHLCGLLCMLVQHACRAPQASLGELLAACAPAPAAVPAASPGLGILEELESWVQRTPQAPAVVDGADSLSYAQLWRRAGELAGQLIAQGAGPERVVGLLAGRTVWAAVGLLAAWRCGAAYLALDPAQPPSRLKRLLASAGAVALVTDASEAARAPDLASCPVLHADRAPVSPSRAPLALPDGHRCAYLMATSGSSGEPKLVAVEHRQLAAYAHGFGVRAALAEGLRCAMVTGWATDLGMTMIVAAWTRGGSLHVVPAGCLLHATALEQFVGAHAIDVLKVTPSHLAALLGQGGGPGLLPSSLLVLGGEASSWALIEAVAQRKPGLRVMNHYGPTETTVGVIGGEIAVSEAGRLERPALGMALASASIHLLDCALRPMPDWVPGEIYVGGPCVSRGYAGAPAATAQSFVPGSGGGRLYATRDRARRLPDGRYEFLGRSDFQVKINGHRVDPGETEVAIRALPGVAHVAVIASTPGGQMPRLLAYIVPRGEAAWDPAAWRGLLAQTLPAHQLPASMTRMHEIPLRDNGKLDTSRLPPESGGDGARLDRTQARVAALWREILGVADVGPDDRFFDIGGHSLQVLQLHQQLRERLQVELPLLELFNRPTVRAIAALVDGQARDDVVAASQERAGRQRAALASGRQQGKGGGAP